MAQVRTNTYPYFDDYDAEKNFHRVLFKPGFPVQARELTQLQTILQDQVRRFGNHIFKDGSVIFGCAESYNFRVPYVKINDTYSLGGSSTDVADQLSDFIGVTLTGETSGVEGLVKAVEDGVETDATNLKTLYVQYLNSGTSMTEVAFTPGERLLQNGATPVAEVAPLIKDPVGSGSLFTVDDGIIYVDGFFVLHQLQTIVIDKYSSTPSMRVGFTLTSATVSHLADTSLLDPAQGSYNYAAPGADRLSLSTVLAIKELDDDTSEGFFLLFDVEGGQIRRAYNKTQYAELRKELARRTYDESGNYTVSPFSVLVKEHLKTSTNGGKYDVVDGGDAQKLAIGIEPGKAYVLGYEYETRITEYVDADKGIDTEVLANQYVSTTYGSYFLVDGVVGAWGLNAGTTVQFRSAVHTGVSGTTYGNTAAPGTLLGTARVRSILWVPGYGDPGTATARYRIYVYDVQMAASSSTTAIASLHLGTTPNASLANLVSGTSLNQVNYPTPIFRLDTSALKTLGPSGVFDTTYVTRKAVTAASNVSNVAAFTLAAGEAWAFSGTLASDEIARYLHAVGSNGAVIMPTAASVSGTTLTATIPGTASTTVTMVGDVRRTVTPKTKQLVADQCITIATATNAGTASGEFSLGVADVWAIQQVWMAADSETFANPTSNVAWTDVTSAFTLKNGQTDGYYGSASIVSDGTLTLTAKKLIVKFSYFNHTGSGSFFSVDSYPVDDTLVSSTTILTYEIPRYTSSTGEEFDLRNCVDFRPTTGNWTTAPLTSVSEVTPTVNPTASSTISTSGLYDPHPQSVMITDLEYYLGRIDKVVLSAEGSFEIVRGVSRAQPTSPNDLADAMTLSLLVIPPYPSLSPYVARAVGRETEEVKTELVDNRRYTMWDIGQIARRINRVEYAAILSNLEQLTANLYIPSASGVNRFKNGILVDAFTGHNVGYVTHPGYKCAVDPGLKELRPYFELENIDLDLLSATDMVRNADDAVVEITAAQAFAGVAGETVSTASGSGVVRNAVAVSTTVTRLYVEQVVGSFSIAQALTSASIASSTVSAVTNASAGDLLLLPYTHAVYAMNPFASKPRNVVSQLLFTYTGAMALEPVQDIWTDTTTRPDVQVNFAGNADNWSFLEEPWNTQWGSWETVWVGQEVTGASIDIDLFNNNQWGVVTGFRQTINTEVSTTTQEQRTGTSTQVSLDSVTRSLGNRVVSATIIPFMRSRIVNFTAQSMKPNTRVYAFFDGEAVSAHCRKTGSTFGAALTTDADGTLTGEFRIPANTFRVGTKTFFLCDDVQNRTGFITTRASQSFTASGLATVEENTIVSTRVPNVTTTQVVESRNLVVDRQIISETITAGMDFFDPIAQTFLVQGMPSGMFLTKLDLFFRTKSSTAPVTVEIREVINGYPSEKTVPFSTVTLLPAQVNVSETAAAATPFVFGSPVYLKNDTEYAIVVLPAGNSTDYNLWVSQLGELELGTTRRIAKQPSSGVLFVSANNRAWSALQDEDMKFTMYRASFDTSAAGEVILRNAPIDYLALDTTVDVLPGQVIASGTAAGTVLYYDALNQVAKVLITSAGFAAADVFTLDGVSSGTITTVEDKYITSVVPQITALDFTNTELATQFRLYTSAGDAPSAYETITPFETLNLKNEYAVFSRSNEVATFGSGSNGTLDVKMTASTSDDNISPAIDLQKVSMIGVFNVINNDSSAETTDAGGASSRYISRALTLDGEQEAEDLQIRLLQNAPAGASVEVYCRVQNALDSRGFDVLPWVKMETTQPILRGGNSFGEYLYTIPVNTTPSVTPSRASTGIVRYMVGTTTYTSFSKVAVKIVFLSPKTWEVPRVREMRAIALQV